MAKNTLVKRNKKAFIDYSDDEEFIRKRNRTNKGELKKATKKPKVSTSQFRDKTNRNVTFKSNYSVMIINKKIFRSHQENNDNENVKYQQESEYNEEEEKLNLEEENKKLILSKWLNENFINNKVLNNFRVSSI